MVQEVEEEESIKEKSGVSYTVPYEKRSSELKCQLITFDMWILKRKSLILPTISSGFCCRITEYLVTSVLKHL